MKEILFSVAGIVAVSLTILAQDYTAEDYDRLVKENPLVVVGVIESRADIPGVIKVMRILKCELGEVKVAEGDEVQLCKTPVNLGWLNSKIEYPEGHVGVWIIRNALKEGALSPAEIVTHFIFPRSALPAPGEDPGTVTAVPQGQWGVTAAPLTKCYTRNGKMLGELKPGKLLDIQDVMTSKAGEVALCSPIEAIGLKSDFVVRTFEIVIYPGRLADVDGETKKLCVQDAVLRSMIEMEKKNLIVQAEARNPHAAQYAAAKDAHEKYWAKVKDLQAKRDSNQGGDLMKYADELRRLKGQDIALANTLERAKEKYEAWKAQNKVDESVLTSPKLEQMQKELSAIQAKLKGGNAVSGEQ